MTMTEEFHAQEAMEQVLHYDLTEEKLRDRQKEMERGGSLTWWDDKAPQAPDEMQYECDAGLGTPSLADCTKIQWQGLGPPSDTVTVGPGTTKFLTSSKCREALTSGLKGACNNIIRLMLTCHSDSCNLAISASIITVVTWAQLQTALDTLMNVCVENPPTAPQGGRAYHQLQTPHKRSRTGSSLTGLNALPSHVNMTILEHKAPATVNCEWEAAQKRQPVSSCGKA